MDRQRSSDRDRVRGGSRRHIGDGVEQMDRQRSRDRDRVRGGSRRHVSDNVDQMDSQSSSNSNRIYSDSLRLISDTLEQIDQQFSSDSDQVYSDVAEDKKEILRGLCEYQVENFQGRGSSANIFKLTHKETGKQYALKFTSVWHTVQETRMLNRLQKCEENQYVCVEAHDYNFSKKPFWIMFDWLDRPLLDLLKEKSRFRLSEIHLILMHLLKTLEIMETVSLIHNDITMDRVMLVNHQEQPFKVKLIDFRSAIITTEDHSLRQYRCFRVCKKGPDSFWSPEEILGLEKTHAIDMWALGMITAHMFLGSKVISVLEEYDPGNPPADLRSTKEFNRIDQIICRFKAQKHPGKEFDDVCFEDWRQMKDSYQPEDEPDCQDLKAFLDLLKKMLMVDPKQRITPKQALCHTFMTKYYLMYSSDSTGTPDESDEALNSDYSVCKVWDKSQSQSGLTTSGHDDASDEASSSDLSVISVVDPDSDGKKSQRFFSNVFRILSNPFKKIQNFLSRGFMAIFCRSHHKPRDNVSILYKDDSNSDGSSGHHPSSDVIQGSCDVRDRLPADPREGAAVNFLKATLNLFSSAFKLLLSPFKKI